MNAARLFVLRTYMYSMHGRQLRRVHVCPSVTEPGNEGYRRLYPLKIFRWYSQTTKNLLHEKRTPENFTTRKFPDLRYSVHVHVHVPLYTSHSHSHLVIHTCTCTCSCSVWVVHFRICILGQIIDNKFRLAHHLAVDTPHLNFSGLHRLICITSRLLLTQHFSAAFVNSMPGELLSML